MLIIIMVFGIVNDHIVMKDPRTFAGLRKAVLLDVLRAMRKPGKRFDMVSLGEAIKQFQTVEMVAVI